MPNPKASKEQSVLESAAKSGTYIGAAMYVDFRTHPQIRTLVSTVAVTSGLLLMLDATLRKYRQIAFCDNSFLALLCEPIVASFNAVWQVYVEKKLLGGKRAVEELKKRFENWRDRVSTLIDAVRLVSLRAISVNVRTTVQDEVLGRLMTRLPEIARVMKPMQREYAARLKEDPKLAVVKKADAAVPDSSVYSETLETIDMEESDKNVASSSSSVTVVDDPIEEEWLLFRNKPRKTLKTSYKLFGIPVLKIYTHEAPSYYAKRPRTIEPDTGRCPKKSFDNQLRSHNHENKYPYWHH